MFNLEMVCADGIFNICDDIFSEKLTKKEAKTLARTFYKNLKDADSCIYSYKEISFNICLMRCSNEEKENILFNIGMIQDTIFDMSLEIFDVFYEMENMRLPEYWSTFNNTTIALIDYKRTLFQ